MNWRTRRRLQSHLPLQRPNRQGNWSTPAASAADSNSELARFPRRTLPSLDMLDYPVPEMRGSNARPRKQPSSQWDRMETELESGREPTASRLGWEDREELGPYWSKPWKDKMKQKEKKQRELCNWGRWRNRWMAFVLIGFGAEITEEKERRLKRAAPTGLFI